MENKEIIKIPEEASKEIVVDNKKHITIDNLSAEAVKRNLKALNEVSKAIKSTLIDGVDFGVIPSTKKPTLFKSGAQKITMLYGLTAKYKFTEEKNEKEGWVEYRVDCSLLTMPKDGSKPIEVAQGAGFVSSREKKYRTQPFTDIQNTILKMAKKRAMVDAVIAIGNLSEVFTQDMEDMTLKSTEAKLSKDDAFALYSLAYIHYAKLGEGKKSKAESKQVIKDYCRDVVFKKLGIEKSNFLAFNKKDAEIFTDHVNKGPFEGE